ncbi:virulence factor family protein [Hydrogenophaga laconesensis]|uniref:Type IV secretory pathway VirJ component n=1 Tax=Hydrogenophaga laconesensis TaxID=1805971 RepID=A0ABU1VGT3_9BURK|nr:virulence factor family protein [Hydrogenophaga laconesensis]MDR7096693.1 type IV secretory pathway VirJ component [Hydrogenophaga laconesensis]
MKRALIVASLLTALSLPMGVGAQGPAPRVAAPAAASAETISHGNFKDVALVRPPGVANAFVLFLSGEDGWTPALAAQAQALAARGALVAGIHTPRLLAALTKDGGDCLLPDGDLENLSHFLQGYARLPAYFPPLLVGEGQGGVLAYAMLAQAPAQTFGGAVSMGFCPALAVRRPLCKGEDVHFTRRPDRAGLTLLPSPSLHGPWTVLQGTAHNACAAAVVQDFVAQVRGAELVHVAGVDTTSALLDAQLKLGRAPAAAALAPDTGVADLPLVPVPSSGTSDTFAVLLSGDGGWAGIDKELAARLAAAGMSVVGLDSLRYFWSARTPEGLANDLDRVLRSFAVQWKKSRALLIGYSQGADVLPFAVPRLPATSRGLVAHTVLIGPGEKASFEFRLSNWVKRDSGGLPLKPELQKLTAANTLCVYGTGDRDTICPRVPAGQVTGVPLPGDHHFNGNYQKLADEILQRTR